MPEQGVNAFTAITDGVRTGDSIHLQRLESGVWVDYRTNSYGIYGGAWQTMIIAGRGRFSPLVTLLNAPPTGQIILVADAYAVWHPGTTNDNVDITITLTCGGYTPFGGALKATSTANANHIGPSGNFDFFVAPQVMQLSQGTASTSDGTYDVFLKYLIVPFPS